MAAGDAVIRRAVRNCGDGARRAIALRPYRLSARRVPSPPFLTGELAHATRANAAAEDARAYLIAQVNAAGRMHIPTTALAPSWC
jgi:hypothetical protein